MYLDNAIHHGFVSQMCYARTAMLQKQFVSANLALNSAREFLLRAEAVAEGKDLHQFKAYDTLAEDFLIWLQMTYPMESNLSDLPVAYENLLALYVDTVRKCGFGNMDENLMKLLSDLN